MMRFRRLAACALVACCAAPAAGQSVQQFDAGSAAIIAERWQEAESIFAALEKRLAGRDARSLAVVRVRRGEALAHLSREAEAKAELTQGLAALPANDPSLEEDRLSARLALGELAERGLDYAEARQHYRAVEQATDLPVFEARALRGLVQTGMFLEPTQALADADRLLTLARPQAKKETYAEFLALKGRVLLNLKRFDEARSVLEEATRGLGGLSLRVDAADIAARSDMSLALLLDGREDDARKYLAYTGAGRTEASFQPAADMNPPPCGAETGLDPADVAVVEFSIRADGSVGYAAPVYVSRGGSGALAFAAAVKGWSWRPDELRDIPPLFRALTRVELRCSTASERPTPVEILDQDFDAWLQTRQVAPLPEDDRSDAVKAKELLAELARREAAHGPKAVQLLPVLAGLGSNGVLPSKDKAAYWRRALEIARGEKAPGPVVALLGISAINAQSTADESWGKAPNYRALYGDPAIAGDPRAAAAVRLNEAIVRGSYEHGGNVKPLLEQVRDMDGLAPHDPIRVGSLVRLSSLELESGDVAGAQAAFAATGLTAQQCALLDAGAEADRRKLRRLPGRGASLGVRGLGEDRLRHRREGPHRQCPNDRRLSTVRVRSGGGFDHPRSPLRAELSPRRQPRLRRQDPANQLSAALNGAVRARLAAAAAAAAASAVAAANRSGAGVS